MGVSIEKSRACQPQSKGEVPMKSTHKAPPQNNDHVAPGAEKFGHESEMTFGQAIERLKAGKRVARAGWNGKGMFLYYVPANKYPAQTAVAKAYWGDRQPPQSDNEERGPILVPYGAYIAMKTAQENVVPWLASQTDVLAEDWEVLKEVVAEKEAA
jgi:hypothetical protein